VAPQLAKSHFCVGVDISGITLDGRLCLQLRDNAFDSAGVVGFLRVLLRTLLGKLLIIWDGAPIHKGQPIKDFLTRGAAKRLHLERLPGYAPDLNPDESIWNYLKRVELKNRCCRDQAELQREVRRATGAATPQTGGHPQLLGSIRLLGLGDKVEISR
jgi:transposase